MYEDYYNDLLELAQYLNYNEAEDLVQETYLRLYNNNSTETIRNKKGYIFGILYNVYKEFIRLSIKYSMFNSSILGIDILDSSDICTSYLNQTIEDTRGRDIAATVLFNKGFTQKEIADLMGIKEESVYVMLSRTENKFLGGVNGG